MEQIIVAQNGSSMMQKGAPDLPKFTESLIIPDIDNMKVEVVDSKFIDVPNISIAPSKGNFSRTILPKNVPYEYGISYEEDAFFPGELAKLDSPYIIRDYRGQALQVYPFQYNPVSKVLRIFTEIKVRVFSDGEIGQNTLDRITPIEKIDKETIMVCNSDLLNNVNLEAFYLDFINSKADFSVVTIPYSVNIPYAVMELENEFVTNLKEKPSFTYYSNGGIYLFKKQLLDLIPENCPFSATDFMEKIIAENLKIKSFPHHGYWLDIGKHEDYSRANEDIKTFNFNL
jgi:hypothetical protein